MTDTTSTAFIAFSPRRAGHAFDPPASERTIRRAIRDGKLHLVKVGQRQFIMRSELVRAAEAGELQ